MGVNNRVRSLRTMLCFKGILTGNIQLKDALTEQRKKPNFSIDVEKFGECYTISKVGENNKVINLMEYLNLQKNIYESLY